MEDFEHPSSPWVSIVFVLRVILPSFSLITLCLHTLSPQKVGRKNQLGQQITSKLDSKSFVRRPLFPFYCFPSSLLSGFSEMFLDGFRDLSFLLETRCPLLLTIFGRNPNPRPPSLLYFSLKLTLMNLSLSQ